jgi:protein-L-isoaspartate(D-aspartate) O-methyltransferase
MQPIANRSLLVALTILAVPVIGQDFTRLRALMVREQIEARGIHSPEVLAAMNAVPRHLFVRPEYRWAAYEDRALPIGNGQTISQPVIVACMTELLEPSRRQSVLEIGTGSGYQAAVLSLLVDRVYTIEIIEALANAARQRLESLGYRNVTVRAGDGYKGWPEAAPFDRIILTSAPPEVPRALIAQLKAGGRLVAPVGRSPFNQELIVLDKDAAGCTKQRSVIPVSFVPMVPGK